MKDLGYRTRQQFLLPGGKKKWQAPDSAACTRSPKAELRVAAPQAFVEWQQTFEQNHQKSETPFRPLPVVSHLLSSRVCPPRRGGCAVLRGRGSEPLSRRRRNTWVVAVYMYVA